MHDDDSLHVLPVPIGKKRIPKACSACRQSKVKCDGDRPCGRCQKIDKQCIFFEIPKDPVSERLEGVESEVQYLRRQLDDMQALINQHQINQNTGFQEHGIDSPQLYHQGDIRRGSACTSASQFTHPHQQDGVGALTVHPSSAEYMDGSHHYQRSVSDVSPNGITTVAPMYEPSNEDNFRPNKRKRSCFEIREESIADFIDKGLITPECAVSCFNTYDRYIPIFDPKFDSFDSVRSRSSILLNAICTVGCMVETRTGGPTSDMLHAELKKWINVIIQNKGLNCLESIQAMLVVACYSAERLLILSFATRMALDLELHEAFEELSERLAHRNDEDAAGVPDHDFEKERDLMRKSRTWFGLLVLEHIFRVDGGKPPGIRLLGNSRRSRILLSHPSTTVLDLRLFSQVERYERNDLGLEVILADYLIATINDSLGPRTKLDGPDISDFVHEMKVDLDIWFDSIAAQEERPFLLAALRVQKCWAEMMLNCKALRAMGVENVATMSPTERKILHTAKSSARRHLRLMVNEPDFYLAKLKYAMDFVWAKCAFAFLLLLKLSRLLPERDEEHEELLEHGNRLVHELSKAGSDTNQTGAGNIYLQILKVSIEKYGRALRESQQPSTGGTTATSPFWELFDAQADLQWFVPEQFVSEWDFPGLNLFYFPTAWQDFFGDFSLAM
ncbi:transcriptional regulator family: Fungal Specific TF [Penicillium odoratum]|uniref:transcriptional regulator family: Fungal Specific TF n=1 Tax=Penicillium odoratum TaxID=1167516 RepID=UPI0025475E23|nr:transcriptional regulator family: Fungal Specific TF [Penicillium odoratum]KAJ5760588.1 transcriptional regulator family: Fungal Specific TF [Penicillium odoratum]